MGSAVALLAVVWQSLPVDPSGRKRVGGLLMLVVCLRSVLVLVFALLFSLSGFAQTWRQIGPPAETLKGLRT